MAELAGNSRNLKFDPGLINMYRLMVRIREFELMGQRLHKARVGPGPHGEVESAAQIPGFLHLYAGQESVAVGVCASLREMDSIASTHRGHGHVIARGGDVDKIMAELFGRTTGYSAGKGGSMHIYAPELGILGTNGIVAGGLPHAVGAAFGHQYQGNGHVAVAFFGDGAANQGVFFESLNLAALWRLPVIFVCENNGYAEWTESVRLTAGGGLLDRARAFGIPAESLDGGDVLAVYSASVTAVQRARVGYGPTLIEARTSYYGGHFEGEEAFSGGYRSVMDTDSWRLRDPIVRFGRQLVDAGAASTVDLQAIRDEEEERMKLAVDFALVSDAPDPEALYSGVYFGDMADVA